MNWAWRLGRFLGIDIYMNATFPLIFVVAGGYVYFGDGLPREMLLPVMGFIPALYLMVLMHEYGHALSARYFGIRTERITLSLVGGTTSFAPGERRPVDMLTVILAGPFVNLMLALGLIAVYAAMYLVGQRIGMPVPGQSVVLWLILANVALFGFNMLPMYPTDGWQVVRTLLAMAMDMATATTIAVTVGRVLSGTMAVVAYVIGDYVLLGLAVFMWWGGSRELRVVRARAALDVIKVRELMTADFTALPSTAPLGLAAGYTANGVRHDFPVVDQGAFVGMLSQHQVADMISRDGPEALVADAMTYEYPVVSPDDGIGAAIARPRDAYCLSIPVVESGELTGMLALEDVAELILARQSERPRGLFGGLFRRDD